ncbi:hypothetical protein [Candidatus Carsonella ruddii]|nr:hypothetical protein [Candidatus Carsonella ruddii]
MIYKIYLLKVNYYLFKYNIFLKELFSNNINSLENVILNFKNIFFLKINFFFCPFYGVKIKSYFNKNNKFIFNKNKKKNKLLKKYKISYKDLVYIFNFSIKITFSN